MGSCEARGFASQLTHFLLSLDDALRGIADAEEVDALWQGGEVEGSNTFGNGDGHEGATRHIKEL